MAPFRTARWVSIVVFVGFLLVPSVPGYAAFQDITGHWAESYIGPLVARGVLSGYPDGQFRPDRALTRAEFTKMLVAALGEPLPEVVLGRTAPVFADVGRFHWSRPFVEAAWEYGWAEGVGARRFQPDRSLTRAEAAALIARAADLALGGPGGLPFRDRTSIPAWAQGPVEAVVNGDLVTGYPDGTFRSQALLTRGEAAALVARLLQRRGALYDLSGWISRPPTGRDVRRIPVQVGDQREITLAVGTGTDVRRNGLPATPADLRFLDEIAVIFDGGEPRWIEAWFVDGRGVLTSVAPADRRITYRDAAERTHAAVVSERAVVFRNGRPADLRDLRAGDRIYMIFGRDGRVRGLDAIRVDIRGTVWGSYRVEGVGVRIRIGGSYVESQWYLLAENAPLFLDGERVSWEQLRLRDVVLATLDGTEVRYLEAYRRVPPPR